MSKTAREVIAEVFGKLVSESNLIEPLRATGPDWILKTLDAAGFVIVPKDLIGALKEIASMPRTPSDELASAVNVADWALRQAQRMISTA